MKFQSKNQTWFIRNSSLNMIPYHCDICDTKFISTAIFEVSNRKQGLIYQKFFIKHDSIPLWHMWYKIRFNSYSFEIQKKETRLEFSSEILLVKTRSCGDLFMFLQNRFLFCLLTGVFKTSLISLRHRAMIKAPCRFPYQYEEQKWKKSLNLFPQWEH